MTGLVYKILRREEWVAAQEAGVFTGSAADARDGFIHLSAGHQVHGVCDRHFAHESDLVLLAVEADRLGPLLKWETSHKGEAFPHLYGKLPLALARSVADIGRDADGGLILPADIA